MSDASQREEALFEAALLLPNEQRAHFLAERCGGNSSLLRRMEILLAAHDAPEGVLERSPTVAWRERSEEPGFITEQSGSRIGRYRLLQQIGEGGCGVVWMAEQESPVRRRVALKIIKVGMDTKQVVARFEAERQALALMDHPHIAKVLDAGATETGRPFFVMELVRGIRITDFCDQHHFATEPRLTLFTQVCHAVQHAHQKGIIHRDIKPSNILVADHDGVPVPKVIDFGIAKATADQRLTDKTVFTAFEQFIGTPAYMSPEQANFSGLDVDTRTDIYSLGVLLYELLTSKTPFDARVLLQAGLDEMRRTIREKEPAPPSTRLSAMQAAELSATAKQRRIEVHQLIHLLRGDLDWIVMKCLEKDRSRRYETANGLAMDVQRYLRNELVIARPPSAAYRFQKLVQRNQLTFSAVAVITAIVFLAFVFLLFSNERTKQERNQKELALQDKAQALQIAQVSERRAREELFASLKNQARARRNSRQMGQRLESLAAVTEAARIRIDPGLRDEAIAALALPDVRRGPAWPVSKTNCVALTCDMAGQRYATLDPRGVVTVRNIENNREIHRFESGQTCVDCYTKLAFSPDGRFLIKVGDAQKTFLWSLESGEEVIHSAPEGSSAPAFSADGRLVALASWQDVVCYEVESGRKLGQWKTAGHIHSLRFHPADQQLAVGYKDGPWVSVYDAATGQEVRQFDVGIGWRMVVAWHPEGDQLAVGSTALGIQVWSLAARRRVARLESHAHEVDYLTFHPSGNWLASWTWDGVMDLWEPTTGRQAMQIPVVAELQFSKDGRWLGFFWPTQNTAQLLELVTPQDYSTLHDHSREERKIYNDCSISPGDRFLAVAMDDGVRVWDFPDRRQVAIIPSGHTKSLVFEATGQALWTCGEGVGIQRWPLRFSGATRSELRFDPPQHIATPFAPKRLGPDNTAPILAFVSEDAGKAALLDLPNQTLRGFSVDHPAADFVVLSPDAKWLATSGWRSDHCRLWDAATGRLAKDWIVGAMTKVQFTPDSRELILAQSDAFRFLSTDTLETRRQFMREIGLFPGKVAFSPDGKLMAMEMAPAVIHLKEVSTGRTLAQLQDPFEDRSDWITFTHEGTQLIVLSPYASAIHIWDLRGIRSHLRSMALDWDWPSFQ